ncbi:MAG: YggT family protein [bacterium]|nr:YggT family protein [bacterium]
MDSTNSPSTKPIYRGIQIAWYILGVIEVLLVSRFLLKLFEANPGAGFTDFIYDVTYVLVSPFTNVFSVSQVTGNIFEWTTLLAMLFYWAITMGIVKMLLMGKTVSTPEAAVKLKDQER